MGILSLLLILDPHECTIFLLSSFLDDVSSAGEHAQEFLELLRKLTEDPKWKSYLAMRGVLPRIGSLIDKVCVCVCASWNYYPNTKKQNK